MMMRNKQSPTNIANKTTQNFMEQSEPIHSQPFGKNKSLKEDMTPAELIG